MKKEIIDPHSTPTENKVNLSSLTTLYISFCLVVNFIDLEGLHAQKVTARYIRIIEEKVQFSIYLVFEKKILRCGANGGKTEEEMRKRSLASTERIYSIPSFGSYVIIVSLAFQNLRNVLF